MTLLFQGYFAQSLKLVHEICFKDTENKKIVIIYFIRTFGKHAPIMSVYLFQKLQQLGLEIFKNDGKRNFEFRYIRFITLIVEKKSCFQAQNLQVGIIISFVSI